MSSRSSFFSSSVGTKVLVALTGLALFAYLILHLAGNVMVFLGPEIFNSYSDKLISNPLIVPVELGLLAIFLLHIFKAVRATMDNRAARPLAYSRKNWAGGASRKSLASSTMIWTGLFTLVFVIIHVRGFKYGPHYDFDAAGHSIRDLYRLEMEAFSNPVTVAFYAIAVLIVGIHLWHGFWSAFQSLGTGDNRTSRQIQRIGWALAVIIAVGFFIIPIWAHFLGGRS
jgi:succinate dehydrogenase / fumarate reductase cytochrome b subunit